MLDKLKLYKLNSYQLNRYVVKGLKSLDISINELLLIIYLTNEKDTLDLIDIECKTSLTEEEILSTYSTLLTKGLIEVKMERVDGKISETISLDNLYNKLIYNEKEDKTNIVKDDIYSAFEKEFGKTLSPIEYEIINKWIESGISEETILAALKEAVLNGVNNLRYIDKILLDWSKKEEKDDNFKKIIDFDWINSEDE